MKVLIVFVCVLITVAFINSYGQAPDRFTNIKYSIVFVDQVQMLYDGLDFKKINHSLSVAADMAYYNGRYFNAQGRYFSAVNFPIKGHSEASKSVQVNNRHVSIGKTGGKHLFAELSLYTKLLYTDINQLNKSQQGHHSALCTAVGLLYQTKGNFIKAETLLTLALEERANTFGRASPEFVNSLHNLAVLKKNQGDYAEAEKMFTYLVDATEKLYFYTSPDKYAVVLNNSAMLMAELGRTEKAIEQLDKALNIGRDHFFKNYIDYERLLTNRAFIAAENGEVAEAEALYKQVMTGMGVRDLRNIRTIIMC